MKGLSLIAQFNFQRAADVAIQKRLSTPESHLGDKKAERRFFLYSASQVRVCETRPDYQSRRRLSTGFIFVVQSIPSHSEGTPLEYQHRLNPQEFSLKKIF